MAQAVAILLLRLVIFKQEKVILLTLSGLFLHLENFQIREYIFLMLSINSFILCTISI